MTNWTAGAACRDADPDLFFPPSEDDPVAEGKAKAICSSCMIRSRCLSDAIDRHEPYGVWGGKNPKERRRLALAWERRAA